MSEDNISKTSLYKYIYDDQPKLEARPKQPNVKLSKAKEQKYIETIKKGFPIVENLQTMITNPTDTETIIAQDSSISTDQVEIISLKGLDISMIDYVSSTLWEFEPRPDFEDHVREKSLGMYSLPALKKPNPIESKKILNELNNIAHEINTNEGLSLDIRNLTPYQACYLIYELISKKINYEYLIIGPSDKDLERIKSGELSTGKPELVAEAIINPKFSKKY